MNKEDKSLWHKRLDDFEAFDRIEMYVVPRYKTSGLSGDEWRQHVQVDFFFKGEKVHETGYRDMRVAAELLSHVLHEACCPIPDRVIELEKQCCDQPSCTNSPVGRLKIKQEFERGHKLHADETQWSDKYRQFCRKHIRRGDCSREDSDDNYESLDGKSADDSTNLEESPSAVAVVHAGSIDEIPGVIAKLREDMGK